MKWYRNLKIKIKLIMGFAVTIVLAIILSIIGILTASSIDQDYSYILDYPQRRMDALADTTLHVARLRRIVTSMGTYVGDTEKLQSIRAEADMEISVINGILDTYLGFAKNDPRRSESDRQGLIDGAESLRTLLGAYKSDLVDNAYEAAMNDDLDTLKLHFEQGIGSITQLITESDTMWQTASDYVDELSIQCSVDASRSITLLIAIVCAVVILSLIVALYIATFITKGVMAVTEAAGKISKGDFNVATGSNDKDEIAMLSNSLNELKLVVQNMGVDINNMADEFAAGKVDISMNTERYSGEFNTIANSVNRTVEDLIQSCIYAIGFVSEIGNGNFDIEVREFPGDRAIMTTSFNTVKDNLISFNRDIGAIIRGAADGNLDVNMDTSVYKGDWSKMAEGINGLLAAIVKPVREAIDVLNQLSEGKLDVSVKGNYKGEFDVMKNALNNTLKMLSMYIVEISAVLTALSENNLDQTVVREYVGQFSEIKQALNTIIEKFNRVISEIVSSADQVAAGAKQISESSMTLATGASEQASATEELSATISVINETTHKNAENAKKANELSDSSKSNADLGEKYMKDLLVAMSNIEASSDNISKIIKVIDDIAFQTNLLALNAAVEAARAGEHGKGFAVVAEEVRTLAGRSQNSAKETSALIEESVAKVKEGSAIAEQTSDALHSIIENVSSVADIIGEISTASSEQAMSINQVTEGISQISEVVQNNSATSEESASSSQQLSSQAELLQNLVSAFKLKTL